MILKKILISLLANIKLHGEITGCYRIHVVFEQFQFRQSPLASNHHDVNEAHGHNNDRDYADVPIFYALILQVLFASMLDKEKSVRVGADGEAGRRREPRDNLVK